MTDFDVAFRSGNLISDKDYFIANIGISARSTISSDEADLQLSNTEFPVHPTAHDFYDQLILYSSSTHVRSLMVVSKMCGKDHSLANQDLSRLSQKTIQQPIVSGEWSK